MAVWASDDFSEADSTEVHNKLDDTGNYAWIDGDFQVQTGKATLVAGRVVATAWSTALIGGSSSPGDLPATDMRVEADLFWGGTALNGFVVWISHPSGATSGTEAYYVIVWPDGSGSLSFELNGTWPPIATTSFSAGTFASGDRVGVAVDSTHTLTAYLNGSPIATIGPVSPSNTRWKRCGISCYGGGGAAGRAFDNFQVEGIPDGWTVGSIAF